MIFIIIMTIYDILAVSNNQYLVGLVGKGKFYLWNLRESLDNEQRAVSVDNNTYCYRATNNWQMSDYINFRIEPLQNNFLLVSNECIRIGSSLKLITMAQSKSSTSENLQSIFSISIANNLTGNGVSQDVNDYYYTAKYVEKKLYIGCASGNIIVYDLVKQSVDHIFKSSVKGESLIKKYNECGVTALDVYNQGSLLLSGTNGGSLATFDTNAGKVINTFKHQQTNQFSPINQIQCVNNKVAYVCHQDYISKWNLGISELINVYDFGFDCQTFLNTQSQLVVGGNVSQIHRLSNNDHNSKWDASFQACLSIRQVGNYTLGTGVGDFVDVFNTTSRVCSFTTI